MPSHVPALEHQLRFLHAFRGRRHDLRGAHRPTFLLQLTHRCLPGVSGIRQGHRHRRATGHSQYHALGLRRLRRLLAWREDEGVAAMVHPPRRQQRLPHLRAIHEPDTAAERLAVARTAVGPWQEREAMYRPVLPNGQGESVQDTVPRHAGPLPRQDQLSRLPRHTSEA